MPDHLVAPRLRNLDILSDQLSRWLGDKMPHVRDIVVRNPSYPSGAGMSHETILFDADWREDGRTVSQALVVRVKPTANLVFPDDLFISQFRIMQFMHERQDVPVAQPLWLEEGDAVIGAPFFVMKQVHGRVPVSKPPYAQEGWLFDATPAQRAILWESSIATLAKIHRVPTYDLSFLEGPEGARSGLDQEWDKYMRFRDWISPERRWPILDAAFEQLRATWPKNQPPGFVWGGAEMVNMMFSADFTVAAVMDWEQPSLGGPLNDLSWWLYMADMKHGPSSGRKPLDGLGSREETIALWSELSVINADDIEWYEDFMAVKIACLAISSARAWGGAAPVLNGLARRLSLPGG